MKNEFEIKFKISRNTYPIFLWFHKRTASYTSTKILPWLVIILTIMGDGTKLGMIIEVVLISLAVSTVLQRRWYLIIVITTYLFFVLNLIYIDVYFWFGTEKAKARYVLIWRLIGLTSSFIFLFVWWTYLILLWWRKSIWNWNLLIECQPYGLLFSIFRLLWSIALNTWTTITFSWWAILLGLLRLLGTTLGCHKKRTLQ